jgi:hypothetical protein
MTTAQERKQALIEHKVITDVLPGEVELKYDLTVRWPNATLENGGELLDREDTRTTPTVHLQPNVSDQFVQELKSDLLARLTYRTSRQNLSRTSSFLWPTR